MDSAGNDIVNVQVGLRVAAKAMGTDQATAARYAALAPRSHGGYGEPNHFTALGVEVAINTLHEYHDRDIDSSSILVSGAGNVGHDLVRKLIARRTDVYVCDPNPNTDVAASNLREVKRMVDDYAFPKVNIIEPSGDLPNLSNYPINVFAPCARHGSGDRGNIEKFANGYLFGLAGAENSVFPDPYSDARAWLNKGVTPIQDFAANYGGVTLAIAEWHGIPRNEVSAIIRTGKELLLKHIAEMEKSGLTHQEVLDQELAPILHRD
jgi:glutamate dehydrogenase/leucine dehydrogenase